MRKCAIAKVNNMCGKLEKPKLSFRKTLFYGEMGIQSLFVFLWGVLFIV